MRRHLSDGDLKDFVAGHLEPAARRKRLVRHLISGCKACLERLPGWRGTYPLVQEPATDDEYDASIDRAWEAVRPVEVLLKSEKELRDGALELVRSKNGWGNLTRAERQSWRGTWAEVEMLLHLSFEARFRDPREMLQFAESAVEAAKRLNAAVYGTALTNDLRAQSSGEMANALRVNEFFNRAGVALQVARSFLEQGTGNLLIEARLDEISGTLQSAENRLEAAVDLLGKAHRAYFKLGERHLAGRTLIKKGINFRLANRPREAVRVLRRALMLLDESQDPQVVGAAQQSLIDALADAGEFREASRLLLASGLRQKFADEPLSLLRISWVQGKIQAGCGRLEDAERTLTEVWQSWCERELEFVAAVAGLDLAKVLLLQGKVVEAHGLAQTLHKRSAVLPHEARHALLTFEMVCRHRAARALYAERVARFLSRLSHDRSLKWSPEMLTQE